LSPPPTGRNRSEGSIPCSLGLALHHGVAAQARRLGDRRLAAPTHCPCHRTGDDATLDFVEVWEDGGEEVGQFLSGHLHALIVLRAI